MPFSTSWKNNSSLASKSDETDGTPHVVVQSWIMTYTAHNSERLMQSHLSNLNVGEA